MSDAVADLLDDAADLIEQGHWVQGMAHHGKDGHCAWGAIYCASTGVFGGAAVEIAATEALASTVSAASAPVAVGRVARWNDAPGRTKQEVLDAFRLAAKRERMGAA